MAAKKRPAPKQPTTADMRKDMKAALSTMKRGRGPASRGRHTCVME